MLIDYDKVRRLCKKIINAQEDLDHSDFKVHMCGDASYEDQLYVDRSRLLELEAKLEKYLVKMVKAHLELQESDV
jgi:hypothetical protein